MNTFSFGTHVLFAVSSLIRVILHSGKYSNSSTQY